METIGQFEFHRLHFNAAGLCQDEAALQALEGAARAGSEVAFISHGFINDEVEAMGLYTEFLNNLTTHAAGPLKPVFSARKLVFAGVFWPSKKFNSVAKPEGRTEALDVEAGLKEQARAALLELKNTVAAPAQQPQLERALELLDALKGNEAAQDEFAAKLFSLLDGVELDAGEGVEAMRAKSGSELLKALRAPLRSPAQAPAGQGGVRPVGGAVARNEGATQGLGAIAGSIFGGVAALLNATTWYVMKNRSGVVGAGGVAAAVRRLRAAAPGVKIHLVGHSLGGRLMASCAKSLAQAPVERPDSLALLEAAFSHYGFSPDNGHGSAGLFVPVAQTGVVKGAFISTFSAQDSVVGVVYAVASRLAGDNVKAIGDAADQFGGIGRNGAQRTPQADFAKLHAAGQPYTFQPGRILNLDGSGGLIKDHSDVRNPAVTWAFGCAFEAS